MRLTTNKIWNCLDSCGNIFLEMSNLATNPDTKKLASLSKLTKLIHSNALEIYSDDTELQNKFKGDVFEIFAELFFNFHSTDNRFGIKNYIATNFGDAGVDGSGTNVNGDRVVVQVKYRIDPTKPIIYEDLSKTWTQGTHPLQPFNIDPTKPNVVVCFTNSFVYYTARKYIPKSILEIGNREISSVVDRNVTFWKSCYEIVNSMRTADE